MHVPFRPPQHRLRQGWTALWSIGILFTLLLTVEAAHGQSVTEWPATLEGPFTYTLHETNHSGTPNVPWCRDIKWTVTGFVKMQFVGVEPWGAEYEAVEGNWSATESCAGREEWERSDEQCYWEISGGESGSGTFPTEGDGVYLTISPFNGESIFSFALFNGTGSINKPWTSNCIGNGAYTGDNPGWSNASVDAAAHGTITGDGDSLHVAMSGSNEWDHSVIEDTHYRSTWSATFSPQAVELVVSSGSYDSWVPEAGPDEATSGNLLDLTARLQLAGGKPADLEAERFTFELVETSREPGIAINFPLPGAAKTTPDLQFDPVVNPDAEISAEGQTLVTPAGGKEAIAYVAAYDYGGFGTLKVTAHMPGGWTLTGYLEGDAGKKKEILLPKRPAASFIATPWKQEHGISSQGDESDAESIPLGDAHGGDGLTLYEEYRGVIENGQHVRLNPFRKDITIFDEIGGASKRAIAMYKAATELEVHHEFVAGEFDPAGRVINPNHAQGPHAVDQHGIRLTQVAGDVTPAAEGPSGRPGLPREITKIVIPADMKPDAAGNWRTEREAGRIAYRDYYAATVAHELAHASNIWHHGERDWSDVEWSIRLDDSGGYARDTDGNLIVQEAGTGPIRVIGEDGVPFGTRMMQLFNQAQGGLTLPTVGVQQGQHSGDVSCFMRYDISAAYPSTQDPSVRYWVGPRAEPVGHTLCESHLGTGVNAEGRSPQPRYGNADSAGAFRASRGDCKSQLCINDKYTH